MVVTVNGSGVPIIVSGLVTFVAAARPPAPFVEVTMSGCAATTRIKLRISVPLLLMTTS